jgi:pyrimidine-nucleoside phosphorylase
VVLELAGRMVLLAGIGEDEAAAGQLAADALSSGRALETFTLMIERHGGNPRVVDDYTLLPSAPDRARVCATRSGYLSAMRAEAIGRASHALGAGRSRVEDAVDHGVGIVAMVTPGDQVAAGDTILELHHRGGHGLERALGLCRAALVVDDAPPPRQPLVRGVVR